MLAGLYKDATDVHLNNIEVYKTLTEPSKWDKIINEYNALQQVATVINSSPAAQKFLKAPSFYAETQVARENAARDYYDLGLSFISENDKDSSRSAYHAFAKAAGFVPEYKDVRRQMEKAYQSSILNVVINPVSDDSYFYREMVHNRFGNSFNNDYLQRSLVTDLGSNYSKTSLAHFYTSQDAQRTGINVDWVIDLTWINLEVPQPYSRQYDRKVNKQIEVGRDTANKPVYQNVSATLHITRKYFTATGDLECRITDVDTRDNINLNRYSGKFDWQQEYATYAGDSRALNAAETAMLNNSNYQPPLRKIF